MNKNFLFHPLGGMLGSTLTSTIGSSLSSSLSSSGSSLGSSVANTALSTISGGIISGINSLFGGGSNNAHINATRDDVVLGNGNAALAILYNHPAKNGGRVIVTSEIDVPALHNLNGTNWDNAFSCIEVADGVSLEFFEHPNFGGLKDGMIGGSKTTTNGQNRNGGTLNEHNLFADWNFWNDRISSFRVKKTANYKAPINTQTNTNMNQSNTKDYANWGPPPIDKQIISKDYENWGPAPIGDNILNSPLNLTGSSFTSTPKTIPSNIDTKQSDYKNSMSYFGIIILVVLGIFIFKKK